MALPHEITARRDDGRRGSKLGDVIRLLTSDNEGEIVATVCALRRILESCDADLHALADYVENAGLTEDDKEKIRVEIENAHAFGYAEGVRAAEAKQNGVDAFRNADGSLDWTQVALFVQREKQRLPSTHHDFIDDMAARTVYGREPTPKQHKYLHSLFFKLGGKITT
jgi:hypothetical protein